jgi:hypothetical protein
MKSITYPTTDIAIISGNSGSTISSTSITTPTLITNSLTIYNGNGITGNILSKNDNGLIWIESPNTSSVNLNMNNNNITDTLNIISTNVTTSNISTATFSNQTTFSTTPISILPTISSQLVTKKYVDDLSNDICNLYLNYSQTEIVPSGGNTGYFKLSNTISGTTGQGITGATITTTPTLISSFITDPINITNIPASLWVLNLYTGITSTTNVFTIYFELYKYSNGVISLIGTSANSGDINTTPNNYPDLYKISLPIFSPVTTTPTDRFIIRLYFISTIVTSTTYRIYFEKNYYSYLQIIANNNQSQIVSGYGITNLNMNNYNITSTNNMNIFSTDTFTITIGNRSSVINIGTDTSVTTNINLGYSGAGQINDRYNYLYNPLTPNYNVLPSTNHLGQIITYSRPGITGMNNAQIITNSYTVPYLGRWALFGTAGFYVNTTGGTISKIVFIGKEVDSNWTIFRQEYNGTQTPTSIGYGNILNGTGIFEAYNDLSRSFIIQQSITFSGGTYRTYNSITDPYIVRAIRLG